MMNDLYIVLNLTLLIIDEWYNESLIVIGPRGYAIDDSKLPGAI